MNGKARTCGVILLVLCIGACSAEVSREPERASTDDLMRADRAFAEATAERGLDAWMAYFAADAARAVLGGDIVRGLAAIRSHDSTLFADDTVRLVWDPTDAGLFRGDELGFTMGGYALVNLNATKPDTLARGTYLTIWRRDGDEWKVILDTGAADPEHDH